MRKICFVYMLLMLCCISGMNANPDYIRIVQKYEGQFSRIRLLSGDMLSFHIFLGVGLENTRPAFSPFQERDYSASITCVSTDGKEYPITEISSSGYFELPKDVIPARFVLSADGYATRTLETDFSGNRFFYSTMLLKDLSVLENECKNTYSPYLLRMLAQCYEDGYLTQKDTAKADSLRKLASRLYADEPDCRVGIVFDGTTGKPLSSVKVTYLDEYNEVRTFTSNTQGEFPLCKSRSVTLSADGFLDRTITYKENDIPIPFITTLQKKGSDIKRMMKSDPERWRFWTWQQALCYLEGYAVKENPDKALDLFCEFDWNAGTTIYLKSPHIENYNDGWYKTVAADHLSYYDLHYRASYLSYPDDRPENIATCHFWAAVLGDYRNLYTWNYLKKNADILTNRKCIFLLAEHDLAENRETYNSLIKAGKLAYEYGNNHIAGSYEKDAVYFEEAKARLDKEGNLLRRKISGGLAFYLSKLYRFGRGVPKDVVKADALLKEASEKKWDEANSLDDLLKSLDKLEKAQSPIK